MTYSKWHRPATTERYLGRVAAQLLHYVDIDCCEYCARCREPLALIETAIDKGQCFKQTVVTERLAARAHVPVYLLFYAVGTDGEITGFRALQLRPIRLALGELTPAEWAQRLWQLREEHTCADGGRLLSLGSRN